MYILTIALVAPVVLYVIYILSIVLEDGGRNNGL